MSGLTFHLIPHTHWDREWYLPQAAFQVRLVTMMDDLIDQMEADERLRFVLDGQTVHLEDYLAVRPEREDNLRRLVGSGRLGVGPWYVLADEQIPSGEALIRNLLLGAADARRFGRRMNVCYAPDSFGHPAFLPLLAREFGLQSGVVWRGLDPALAGGRDLLRWRGPNGREILVYHLPAAGYEVGCGLPDGTDALPDAWARIRPSLVGRASGPHVAVFVGADHHALHPGLTRLADALAALEPGHDVRISLLDDFLSAVEEAVSPEHLPVVHGELRRSAGYTWTLQGVHSTRPAQKRRNSRLELWLERFAEPLTALVRLSGGPDRRALVRLAWRRLIQCQFHDSIAGSCSDDVALAVEERFRQVGSACRETVRAALHHLAGHDPDAAREIPGEVRPSLLLWNPSPRARAELVRAEISFFRRDVLVGPPGGRRARSGLAPGRFALREPSGGLVPLQVVEVRRGQERLDAARHYPDQDEVDIATVAFHAPQVRGLALTRLELVSGGTPPVGGVVVEGTRISNQLVEVGLTDRGALSVLDRRTGRRFDRLLELEDEADRGDTYTWCPVPGGRSRRGEGPIALRVLSEGPLVGAIEARWQVRGATGPIAVSLVVTLQDADPAVRCTLTLNNQADWHRLRAHCNLGFAGREIMAGAQLGCVRRQAASADERVHPMETPVNTAPAHRFAAVTGADHGLALMLPGFFEYEWTAAGDLILTLLRAVGELSRGDLATRPGHAGWPRPTPLAQGRGGHRIDLTLLPLAGPELDPSALMTAWEGSFLPLSGLWIRDFSGGMPREYPSIELEGGGLIASAFKPVEQGTGLVLRCYNPHAVPAAGCWHFGAPVRAAALARADETILAPLALSRDRQAVPFEVEAGGVATIIAKVRSEK